MPRAVFCKMLDWAICLLTATPVDAGKALWYVNCSCHRWPLLVSPHLSANSILQGCSPVVLPDAESNMEPLCFKTCRLPIRLCRLSNCFPQALRPSCPGRDVSQH